MKRGGVSKLRAERSEADPPAGTAETRPDTGAVPGRADNAASGRIGAAQPEAAIPGLTLTGERTLPGIAAENYWFRRHQAAYLAAAYRIGRTGRVLEAGVGEGYGAELLAAAGNTVVGLDYDSATTDHVRRAYPQVRAVRGNVVELPFGDATFDAVVSMQVVEHLWDRPRYAAECARVLRPGGTLVISTPNRFTFSPGYDPATGSPANPFHTREYSDAELADLLTPYFKHLTRYGLLPGPRVREADAEARRRYGTDLVAAQLATPPADWTDWLRRTVGSITADDFELSTEDVDSSLDLVVFAHRAADQGSRYGDDHGGVEGGSAC